MISYLLNWSLRPLKNCIAWSSLLICARIVGIRHEHLTGQKHVGVGLKFSNSSQMMHNFVKKSKTLRSPWLRVTASNCRLFIRARSPWENLFLRFVQMSRALSIHMMFCLMVGETEWMIQEATMLHQCQVENKELLVLGGSVVPRMNLTLFLALKAVIMDRLHEW